MIIRKENASDINAIERLTYQAFENHPHHEVGAKPTEHLIINNLRADGALTLSLVAEDKSGIVGHIAFSSVNINREISSWYGIGPVSVSVERQREGIGGTLIRAGIAELKMLGAGGVVLLGEPQYYGRFGFKSDPRLVLPGVPAEYFMAQVFDSEMPSGEVSYHPSFS